MPYNFFEIHISNDAQATNFVLVLSLRYHLVASSLDGLFVNNIAHPP